tara:strand:- start:28 stop:195 length:168 start_codon:yes stop_codon:yes gene_type:complete
MKKLNNYILSFILISSVSVFAQDSAEDSAEGEPTTIQGLLLLVQEGRTSEKRLSK